MATADSGHRCLHHSRWSTLSTRTVLDGSIVYAGTPGEVFVFRRGNDPLIVVVADTGDTCRLLVSQLLHQGT
jgi:hypothetical protein